MKFILIPLILAFALAAPLIWTTDYWHHLMVLATIYAIVALGLNFTLGLTGQLSLAQAAFWGIGAYTSALLTVRHELPFWIGLPAAAVVSAFFGILLGFPSFKLSGHYLAMTTIGFGIIVRLVLQNETDLTGGADGIAGIPAPTLLGFAIDDNRKFYYFALGFLILLSIVALKIQHSRAGRAFQAIRENEMAASATGVNINRYKLIAFMFSALYAGIAGSLYAHSASYISPDTFSFDQSVIFLVMLVLGGSGSVYGTLIGATLITFLPEWLRFLKSYYMAVYGAGVLLMMIFLPTGIWGLLEMIYERIIGKPLEVVSPLDRPREPREPKLPAGAKN
jgi:branched-chain amino acid transport system permease protein